MAGSRTASARSDAPAEEPRAGVLARAEVRDVLAWMRLLLDPQDSSAVVRALTRPPVELRQVDLARVIQVARRRKLDLVAGLAAARESPQVPPEARERIARFVELHGRACASLRGLPADAFVAHLIELVAARECELLAGEELEAQSASLERLRELAERFAASEPSAGLRELTRHLAAALPDTAPEPAAAAPQLEEMLAAAREELLRGVARIGSRLGELRLDTDLDISHGVVRYLELLKLSALVQRGEGRDLEEALADVNARLLAAATPLQREILQSSPLDEALLAGAAGEEAGAHVLAPREERSFGPFLPRRGIGLALSASDIQTYRSCPLRYKFARVLRIPAQQTASQRFGIVVHQVLERYHAEGAGTLAHMLELLELCWRRAGLGAQPQDAALYARAREALARYHARLEHDHSTPLWFERAFDFRLGPHHLRGRVDRVDRVPASEGAGESYELIDYKTSRAKSADELADDVQLSLYALAAREAWQLECTRQAYYYVLDDVKVSLPHDERGAGAVRDVVLEVGDGILAQAFEPTPSQAACSMCDYRIVCPAAAA